MTVRWLWQTTVRLSSRPLSMLAKWSAAESQSKGQRRFPTEVGQGGRISAALIGCGLIATVALAGPLSAQPTVTIDARASCLTCRLTMTPVLTLGDSTGGGMVSGATMSLAQDRLGRLFITHYRSGWMPQVFARNGAFSHVLGRPGDGPGEYRRPALVRVGPDGRVYVFDSMRWRITVLSPTLQYQRSYPVKMRSVLWGDALVLPGGRTIIAAAENTRERMGLPVHL